MYKPLFEVDWCFGMSEAKNRSTGLKSAFASIFTMWDESGAQKRGLELV